MPAPLTDVHSPLRNEWGFGAKEESEMPLWVESKSTANQTNISFIPSK
jgi:hypothetical protein